MSTSAVKDRGSGNLTVHQHETVKEIEKGTGLNHGKAKTCAYLLTLPTNTSSTTVATRQDAGVLEDAHVRGSAVELNFDVAFMIVELLQKIGSNRDLVALASVNKVFNAAATPILFKTVVLDFQSSRILSTAKLIAALSARPDADDQIHESVQAVTVLDSSTEKVGRRIRLKKQTLKNIISFVKKLPNLKSFNWHVHEPMPPGLHNALRKSDDHSVLTSVLLTNWGQREDERFIERLTSDKHAQALIIEYRPRMSLSRKHIEMMTFKHRRLLTSHAVLKELTIDMSKSVPLDIQDVTRLPREYVLTELSTLSLISYTFEPAAKDLHRHINIENLQCLNLQDCKRSEILFLELLNHAAMLKELKLINPIWRDDSFARSSQQALLQSFLDTQISLEVLELEAIGFSRSVLHYIIFGQHVCKFKKLALRDLDYRAGPFALNRSRVSSFKSLSVHDIHDFRKRCPNLETLEIDLTCTEFTPNSAIIAEFSRFTKLKQIVLTTQINTGCQIMMHEQIYHVANTAWPAPLLSFTVKVRSLRHGLQIDEENWLVTATQTHMNVTNMTVANEMKRIADYAKALDLPIERYGLAGERRAYLARLESQVVVLGKTMLNAIELPVTKSTGRKRKRI